MKRYSGFLIGLSLIASTCTGAGISPRQDYTNDVSRPSESKILTFIQSASQDLGWAYKQNGSPVNLSSATLVLFSYTPKAQNWVQVCTGAVDSATGGKVLVKMTPAQLNTNGVFAWRLEIQNTTQTLVYSFGTLLLQKDYTHGVTGAFPTSDSLLLAQYVKTNDTRYMAAVTNSEDVTGYGSVVTYPEKLLVSGLTNHPGGGDYLEYNGTYIRQSSDHNKKPYWKTGDGKYIQWYSLPRMNWGIPVVDLDDPPIITNNPASVTPYGNFVGYDAAAALTFTGTVSRLIGSTLNLGISLTDGITLYSNVFMNFGWKPDGSGSRGIYFVEGVTTNWYLF